jgi:penicillin-binding protein 1A
MLKTPPVLKTAAYILGGLVFLGLVGAAAVTLLIYHYGRGLPDYHQLADYNPPMVTRVFAGDGRLLAEYATERRVFVPIEAIPKRVVHAFLAAEDKNFYTHPGVDVLGVMRATAQNLASMGTGRRPVGASTITQQVAKNFLLTNEVSLGRKVKEAILAFRIEQAFSKDKILELYLNEIYLGSGSYGAAAAALNYFDKSLDELTVGEAAFLGALPKAPNNYNPIRFPDAAKSRRDWVIERMAEDGYITAAEAKAAEAEPLAIHTHSDTEFADAGYFAEEVRRQLVDRFGDKQLYSGGMSVHSTLDPTLQAAADKSLRAGLIIYDRRHGWRGPVGKIKLPPADMGGAWVQPLADFPRPVLIGSWQLAVVLSTDNEGAAIGIGEGEAGRIPFDAMRWARPWKEGQRVGASPRNAADVVQRGDVVLVEPLEKVEADRAAWDEAETGEAPKPAKPAAKGKQAAKPAPVPDPASAAAKPPGPPLYALRQIPDVSGAVVVLDPHTGRVLAMTGGYQFERSKDEFNRAVQAKRQPGSSFKPFVYLTAMDNGFTPSSMVQDAPFAMDQGPGLGWWKPGNFDKVFFGPKPLRFGLEDSRNLMTVRVAAKIGMEKIAETAEAFGVVDHLPRELSMSLGAGETTLLRLTNAYGEFVNGGKKITPAIVDYVQDRHGKLIYRHDERPCVGCADVSWDDQAVPDLPDTRAQLDDPGSIYQVVAMMQGVIERGTGRRARVLGKPLGGKTGTTDDARDTWFIGFSPDLVCGIFVGFDQPKSLGPQEQGATAAVPIFVDFMKVALKDKPAIPFRIPPGLEMVRVRESDGLAARAGDKNAIWEPFKPGTEPESVGPVLDGSGAVMLDGGGAPGAGAGASEDESEAPSRAGGAGVGAAGAGTVTPGAAPATSAPAEGTGGLY